MAGGDGELGDGAAAQGLLRGGEARGCGGSGTVRGVLRGSVFGTYNTGEAAGIPGADAHLVAPVTSARARAKPRVRAVSWFRSHTRAREDSGRPVTGTKVTAWLP
ncbi:hypothetical protein GA0115253_106694 [Streptomyces sp. Termitarium-T10T-6]|nr:hypothetical protein GA0115253_106694 [Streptomyces sp. Termitarium-T10T-6]